MMMFAIVRMMCFGERRRTKNHIAIRDAGRRTDVLDEILAEPINSKKNFDSLRMDSDEWLFVDNVIY